MTSSHEALKLEHFQLILLFLIKVKDILSNQYFFFIHDNQVVIENILYFSSLHIKIKKINIYETSQQFFDNTVDLVFKIFYNPE